MNQEISSKDKYKDYSLSDLIHLRYTINSKGDAENYNLIIDEIRKRKKNISYYSYRQFIADENLITILKKSKILNEINNSWEDGIVKGIIQILKSPFTALYGLTKLFLFTIYNYYTDSKYEQSPYFSSVLAVMGVIFLNLMTIFALFQFDIKFIVLWNTNASRLEQYFQVFLYYAPFYFIIKYIFPEEKVIKSNYDESTVFLAKWFVLIYIILSFALFVISALLKHNKI